MGGAGIALAGGNNSLNPAHLGLMGNYRLGGLPTIEYRASGQDISNIMGFLSQLRTSGMRFDGRTNWANVQGQEWGRDMGGSIGLGFGNVRINFFGRGFETYRASNGAVDAYGLGYSGYSLSFGTSKSIGRGRLSAGSTAKMITAVYDHKRLDENAVASRGGAGRTQSGLGMDLGLHYTPDLRRNLHLGLSIENLVSPGIQFDSGKMSLRSSERGDINPFKTAFHAGIAGSLNDRTWFACDVIDIGKQIGRSQMAMGLEHSLNRYLTMQLGYNSRSSLTVGVSFMGLYARVAGKTPLTVGTNFRF